MSRIHRNYHSGGTTDGVDINGTPVVFLYRHLGINSCYISMSKDIDLGSITDLNDRDLFVLLNLPIRVVETWAIPAQCDIGRER